MKTLPAIAHKRFKHHKRFEQTPQTGVKMPTVGIYYFKEVETNLQRLGRHFYRFFYYDE